MSHPQNGIFNENAQHFYFLEYQLTSQDVLAVKQAIQQAIESKEGVDVTVSFGLDAWQQLQPAWSPATLENFTTLNGQEGHVAPSTQRDLFFWLQGLDISDVFDQSMAVHHAMQEVAEMKIEERGFHYHTSLDLIGFEDGTANPKTDELRRAAACIPEGQPGAGGSLVLSQKWVHDMDKWSGVPVHCQEKIVGRTKVENEELEGDAMPMDSHVSRTDLKVDGTAMKIYRRSAPYGSVKEKGLFFLAFGCELQRFTSQLNSMYGLTEDKTIDQLINYSKAVTGSYWFAPSQEDLAEALK